MKIGVENGLRKADESEDGNDRACVVVFLWLCLGFRSGRGV